MEEGVRNLWILISVDFGGKKINSKKKEKNGKFLNIITINFFFVFFFVLDLFFYLFNK
jgi:hypothetical protein